MSSRKRKAPAPPASRRAKTSRLPEASPPNPHTKDTNAIDYDQLAAAIIRQRGQTGQNQEAQAQSTTGHDTSQNPPEVNTVTPHLSTPSTGIPPPAPTFSTVEPNNSNSTQEDRAHPFNSFIDRLFSGESLTCVEPPHPAPLSVADDIPLGTNIPIRIKQKIWSH